MNDLRSVIASSVDGIMTDLPDRLRAMIEDPPPDFPH
jgi:hypothetical protein